MMQEDLILSLQNISKSYEHPAKIWILKDLFLEAKKGETIAILGPSGVGKSTLLNILGTLENPSSGSLTLFTHSFPFKSPEKLRNESIGFIFQSYHLLNEYTSLENILMPAKIARKPTHKSSPSYKRALELLEQVSMSDKIHHLTKLLSGGEKQRIAIARALCNDPSLILADEPSGNLDEENAKIIHDLLLTCVKKQNKTLILVTHNMNLANLCDTRYLLTEGQLKLL